jgi:cytochrome c biogenesis protein CcmG, thiol:disulfide interchange protein DsbE
VRTALAAVLVVLLGACSGSGGNLRAEVGRPAPTFAAQGLSGFQVELASYRKRPVLLNFFASWCIPCRDELPLLQRTFKAGQAAVVGVVFDDAASNARDFMTKLHVTYPAVADDGKIAKAYGVGLKPGLPVTYAISPGGVLAARHLGQLRESDVPALIAAATRRG